MKSKHWETNEYYEKAHEASLNNTHESMVLLKELSRFSKIILDLGCGEGTRLDYLASKNGTGVEISQKAISLAKKKSKNKFVVANLENLPFKDETFDLVYSAFVLEHTDNYEKVITEAVRVLCKDGNLVLTCPNYGSPNRCSPPSTGSRIKKLLVGFLGDFVKENNLNWNKVTPIKGKYFSDSDTTVEPYARSLYDYLISLDLDVVYASTLWQEELEKTNIMQKIFKKLSDYKIYPFKFWGPHILIHAKKH